MRIIQGLVLAVALALGVGGCKNDCSDEGIFHCPLGADLECIDGHYQCLPIDGFFAPKD